MWMHSFTCICYWRTNGLYAMSSLRRTNERKTLTRQASTKAAWTTCTQYYSCGGVIEALQPKLPHICSVKADAAFSALFFPLHFHSVMHWYCKTLVRGALVWKWCWKKNLQVMAVSALGFLSSLDSITFSSWRSELHLKQRGGKLIFCACFSSVALSHTLILMGRKWAQLPNSIKNAGCYLHMDAHMLACSLAAIMP